MEYYIDLDKYLIPYQFSMRLDGITWGFEVNYNSESDFFTLELSRRGEVIAIEKVIYNRPLFADELNVKILPYDPSGNSNRAGWNELGESVFLFLEGDEFV